jgi:hypothetical protein
MNSTEIPQPSPHLLRNVDLCRRISALRWQPAAAAQPIFPDADAGLHQLFRRPVTVPWLANSDAYRSLAE